MARLRSSPELLTSSFKLISASRAGLAGFAILAFYIVMAIIGPILRPLDTIPKPHKMYLPPSWEHPLGTDNEGRDILSEVVCGASSVLYVAFLAAATTVLIATLLGSLAGFKGGIIDSCMMSIVDILLTIPQFPLMAILSGIMRLDDSSLALLIGLLSWPALARAIRSQVLSLKERDFIEAAKALGLGAGHIVLVELMPNLMPYVAVNFAFAMISAVYTQVGLVFLGLVPFRSYNWGVMINLAWVRGAIYYRNSVYYILSPIMAIVGFELGAIMLARGLELLFNPRLRE